MADHILEEGKLCRRCNEVAPQEFRYCPRCGGNAWTPLPPPMVDSSASVSRGVGRLRTVPWTTADVAKGLVFFVALAVFLSALFVLALLLFGDDSVGLYALLVTFLVEALLVAAVWLFAVSKYHISWRTLGLWQRPGGSSVALAAAVVVAGIVVQGVYLTLLESLGVDIEGATGSTFLEEGGAVLVLLSLLALAVAPVAEEIFFRGFVFGGLANRFGFWWGAAASAAAFALAHIEPIKLFPLFVLGILLAWVYYKTGSLWSSVLAHLFNNTIALVVLLVT
ncbi:MAG: CPBP family glutamic-type intramembrane protease [Dehalococcoidia bacterium]